MSGSPRPGGIPSRAWRQPIAAGQFSGLSQGSDLASAPGDQALGALLRADHIAHIDLIGDSA
jgi:hypothetical protein